MATLGCAGFGRLGDIRPSDELVRAVGVVLLAWGPVFAFAEWVMGRPVVAVTLCVMTLVAAAFIWGLRAKEHVATLGHVLVVVLFVDVSAVSLLTGGIDAPAATWLVLVPLLSAVLLRRTATTAWVVATALMFGLLYVASTFGWCVHGVRSGSTEHILHALAEAGLLVGGFAVCALYEDYRQRMVDLLAERNAALRAALDDVRTLRGLIPICMRCKSIRNDAEQWQKLEAYLESHSDAEFTHSLCHECLQQHCAELDAKEAGRELRAESATDEH